MPILTLSAGNFCLFVECVLVVKPLKQHIKHQRDSTFEWDFDWDSSISVKESQGLLTRISTNEKTPKTVCFEGFVVC